MMIYMGKNMKEKKDQVMEQRILYKMNLSMNPKMDQNFKII